MKTETRTDIHRPSAEEFDPAQYEFISVFDLQPEFPYGMGENERRIKVVNQLLEEGKSFRGNPHGQGQCSHCGAHIRYAALMVHSSGTMVWIGEQCLDNRFSLTQAEFKNLRENAKLNRDRMKKDEKVSAILANMTPELKAAFDWAISDDYPSDIARDIAEKVSRNGWALSEKQEAFLVRLHTEHIKREQGRQAREKAIAEGKVQACPTGRIVVTGKVVSTKWVDNDFGGSLKMVVEDDRGFRVYGTVPFIIGDVQRDDRVSFTATLQQSEKDAAFGFYSRPSKAKVF